MPVVSVFLTAVSVPSDGADRGAGGRNQMHVGEVDVGEADRAAVGQVAGRGDLLGDRADQSCAVITGASLVPVMVTSICLVIRPPLPVVERDGEALDLGLAGGQILHRGIGNRVGPGQLAAGAGAGGVAVLDRRQRAERGPIGRAGGRNQMHVGEVDVGEADGAAVGQVAGRGDLLGDRADQILRGDHRRVVGAGDGDVDLLGDQAAVWSSSVMVKLSTLVWPAARYSTAESATV